jgi:hypothetical protein
MQMIKSDLKILEDLWTGQRIRDYIAPMSRSHIGSAGSRL